MGKELLDILYKVLVSPSRAFEEMGNKRPLGWALLTAVFIAIVIALNFIPNPNQLLEVIFTLERGSLSLTLIVFIWVIIFLAALFIGGGIFHFIAGLFRGQGSYLGMVCGLCFACFPLVFFAPLTFLRALLGSVGNILYPFGSLIFFLWVLVLEISAIRQNYCFSTSRAIATYFIPVILLIIVPLLIVIISMAF